MPLFLKTCIMIFSKYLPSIDMRWYIRMRKERDWALFILLISFTEVNVLVGQCSIQEHIFLYGFIFPNNRNMAIIWIATISSKQCYIIVWFMIFYWNTLCRMENVYMKCVSVQFSCSVVSDSATPWTTAH